MWMSTSYYPMVKIYNVWDQPMDWNQSAPAKIIRFSNHFEIGVAKYISVA